MFINWIFTWHFLSLSYNNHYVVNVFNIFKVWLWVYFPNKTLLMDVLKLRYYWPKFKFLFMLHLELPRASLIRSVSMTNLNFFPWHHLWDQPPCYSEYSARRNQMWTWFPLFRLLQYQIFLFGKPWSLIWFSVVSTFCQLKVDTVSTFNHL